MRPLVIVALAILVSTLALAQTPATQKTPDCGGSGAQNGTEAGTGKPCQTTQTAEPQSVRDRFPYPGEPAASPAHNSELPATPGAQPPSTPQSPEAAKRFPYPGDSSSAANNPSSSSSSSSSSDSSSSSSSDPDPASGATPASDSPHPDADADTHPSTRRKLPKVKQIQSNEDRESEDLTVAKFYRQSGNLQAAYLRTKDAVQMLPDDPEAHFALAEVAMTLKKKQEAIAEYVAYLKLDPDGDGAKAARKALASLQ